MAVSNSCRTWASDPVNALDLPPGVRELLSPLVEHALAPAHVLRKLPDPRFEVGDLFSPSLQVLRQRCILRLHALLLTVESCSCSSMETHEATSMDSATMRTADLAWYIIIVIRLLVRILASAPYPRGLRSTGGTAIRTPVLQERYVTYQTWQATSNAENQKKSAACQQGGNGSRTHPTRMEDTR